LQYGLGALRQLLHRCAQQCIISLLEVGRAEVNRVILKGFFGGVGKGKGNSRFQKLLLDMRTFLGVS
jgi:hypothetical protein